MVGPDPNTLSWSIESVRKRLSSLITALSAPFPRATFLDPLAITSLQELELKLLNLQSFLSRMHVLNELVVTVFLRDVKCVSNFMEDLLDELEYEIFDLRSRALYRFSGANALFFPNETDLINNQEIKLKQFQASICQGKRKCAYVEETREMICRVDELVGREELALVRDGFLGTQINCKRGKVFDEGDVLQSGVEGADCGFNLLAGDLTVKAKELGKNFDELTNTFALLSLRDRGPHNIINQAQDFTPTARPPPSIEDGREIIGRRKDLSNVLKMLLSEKDGRISVLAVTGIGGLGKTTLAQLVYNHPKIHNHFDLLGWVCVSRNFDVKAVTRSMIISVEKRYCDSSELDSLQRRLSDRVTAKSIFLVLDDVWNEDHSLWEALLLPLQSARACQILVTSCNNEVARTIQTMPTYHLGYLPYEDCWSLFKNLVHQRSTQYNLDVDGEMVEIGKKIVNKCRGLPLAIKAIGSVLSYRGIDFWKETSNREIWDLDIDNHCEDSMYKILPALKLSYDQMPKNLKLCFTIFSLFPKGYIFLKDDLTKLWMSLDLIELNSTSEPEDTAGYYFNDLVQRSLIEQVPHNKRPRGFVMHDLVHDLAQFVAGGEFKRAEAESSSMRFTENHVSDSWYLAQSGTLVLANACDAQYVSIVVNDLPKNINLRPMQQHRLRLLKIINLADKWNNCINIDLPGDQLGRLKHLRVLDFSHTGIETLHDSIGNLKQLRYLNLTKSNVKKLPDSISYLYRLQTLELRDCPIVELPLGMKKLINLRHLSFSDKNTCMPQGIGQLTNLQTLPIFNIKRGNWHCDISELKGLINLRGELTITGLENVSSVQSVKDSNLQSKRNLLNLTLQWSNGLQSGCDHYNNPSFGAASSYHEQHVDLMPEKIEEVLENLQPNMLLEELHINGYSGYRYPRWLGDASFSQLSKITLTGCGDNCEVLPTLGLIPALKYLSIQWMYSIQHIRREFCSHNAEIKGFQLLQTLELKYIPNLVEWSGVEHGEFCRLHTLRLVCCNQLQSLPEPLSSSLSKLLINNCAELSALPYLPSLTSLTLSGELSESLLYNSHLPSLKHLKIACSQNITLLSLNGKRFALLEVLIIKGCKYLQSIVGLSSIASLKRLEIVRCSSLQISSNEEIPLSLQQLTVVRCYWLREWHQTTMAKFENQVAPEYFRISKEI